jgi:hypothetical protein
MAKINEFSVGDIVYDCDLGIQKSPKLEILDILNTSDVSVKVISLGCLENTGIGKRKVGDIFIKQVDMFNFSL